MSLSPCLDFHFSLILSISWFSLMFLCFHFSSTDFGVFSFRVCNSWLSGFAPLLFPLFFPAEALFYAFPDQKPSQPPRCQGGWRKCHWPQTQVEEGKGSHLNCSSKVFWPHATCRSIRHGLPGSPHLNCKCTVTNPVLIEYKSAWW